MAGPNFFDQYDSREDKKVLAPGNSSKVRKDNNEARASDFEPGTAAAKQRIAELELRIKGIEAGNAGPQAQIDLQKARLELQKLQAELDGLKTGKGSALNALQSQLDRVNALYSERLKGGAPNGFNMVVPDMFQPDVAAFDSAAQGLVNPFMASFRIPGVGAQSDTELRQFLAANTPEQGDSDAVIEEKIGNIQRRIDAERGPQPANAGPQPALPADQQEIATGQTRTEADPFRKGVMARASAMIVQGVPRSKVERFVRDNGLEPKGFESLYRYRASPDFQKWQRANPGAILPLDPDSYTREIPVSDTQRKMGERATSPGGAFVASAANAISGNHLDDIANLAGGSGEAANTGLMLAQSAQPQASFLGDMTGQGLVALGTGSIPGIGNLGGKFAPALGDLAYGAYSGHGQGNTIGGALANAGGGALFRGGSRLLGSGIRGVTGSESLRYLNDRNIPLTPGRIGRGTDSTLGNGIGGLEERAAGLPIFDAIIGSARRRGDEGFNREMFKQIAGSDSGKIGVPALAEARTARNNAYSFLDSATLNRDTPFDTAQSATAGKVAGLPDFGAQVGRKFDLLSGAFDDAGQMSGRRLQDSVRSIRKDRGKIVNQPFGDDAAGLLGEAEGNLFGLVERQLPGGKDALANANAINSRFKTAQTALKGRVAQRNGVLTDPTTLNDVSIRGAEKFGGLDSAMEGKRPFFDLTQAGMEVMPNLTPDSGTAGRSLFYAALPSLVGGTVGAGVGGAVGGQDGAQTGGGIGLGTTMLPTMALAALYSKGGQKALQKALLGKRPAIFKNFGDKLIKRDGIAGILGAALSRDLFLQPELPK